MQELTPEGRRIVEEVAARHGVSADAVVTLLRALVEVGRAAGCPYAMLVQTAADIDWRALEGVRSVGLSAGARYVWRDVRDPDA